MVIVGVCGASGSGKSTLAKRIADNLACSCIIIGQDCYYKNYPHLPFEERIHINYDAPDAFDYEEILRDFNDLQSGRAITRKGYDYANHLRADTEEKIIPPEVLIFEGIHVFHNAELCELMSLKVYMHVDIDVCLLRRIKRDIKFRARTIDNIAAQYMDTVKPMYEQHIAGYINDADFAIMRGGKNIMAIDAISAYLTTKVLADRFEKERRQRGEEPQSHTHELDDGGLD